MCLLAVCWQMVEESCSMAEGSDAGECVLGFKVVMPNQENPAMLHPATPFACVDWCTAGYLSFVEYVAGELPVSVLQ